MKHLLSVSDMSVPFISSLLDRSMEELIAMRQGSVGRAESMRGKTVVNLFLEASTRTRVSFELAAKRLGADVVNIASSGSSISKGETLLDTVRTLAAMHADVFVVRHSYSGSAQMIADSFDQHGVRSSVINAGDGLHEHPTQALLDAVTIRSAFGLPSDDFSGLLVVIAGDVMHSRVARSNVALLTKLGAHVRLCAPRTLMPAKAGDLIDSSCSGKLEIFDSLDEAISGAHVAMMLRIQKERLSGGFIASTKEYARHFGMNESRLTKAHPDAIVMHPGPMNRGIEISSSMADHSRSRILDQVEAGVATRIAVLRSIFEASESSSE